MRTISPLRCGRTTALSVSLIIGAAAACAGTLSLSPTGGGSLSADPALADYPDGTVVTITATAPPGTWLQAWGGAVPAHERWTGRSVQQVTVSGATVVSAQFGDRPPVRFFKTGGDSFRASRLSPDGRYALGAWFPDTNSMGKPAFRDRESRVTTVTSTSDGEMKALSADGLRGVGSTWFAAQNSFAWTPAGTSPVAGGDYAVEISRDGTVVGASRFVRHQEFVTFGAWGSALPAIGTAGEYYGAMSGDGRLLYSFISGKLITHDRIAGSRTETDVPTGWNFYPYNMALNYPAGSNHDGSVLAATFSVFSAGSYLTQAAIHRGGTWSVLPGSIPSAVFRVSDNGSVATGSTDAGSQTKDAVWKLGGSAPVRMTAAAYLAEEGAWLPPVPINGVADVSDDGSTLLVHEEEGQDPYPNSGWEANWIAVRPRIREQTITFSQPEDAVENGPPISLTATASPGLPVKLRLVSGPGRIADGQFIPGSSGTAIIEASQSNGGENYLAAIPVTRTLTIADDPALAEVTLFISGGGHIEGGPATTFVPVDTPINLLAVPDGDPALTAFHSWQITSRPVAGPDVTRTVLDPALVFTPSNGRHVLTAKFAAAQTITFDIQAAVRGDTSRIPFTATATSGLPVAVTIVSGAGSLSDGYFYPAGSGEVVLVARQPGNDGYAPAAEVIRSINVFTDPQTITFDIQAAVRGDTPRIPFTATATSGLPVAVTIVSGAGSLSDGYFYPAGSGEVVLVARQPGNDGYAPAAEVIRSINVFTDPQTITFDIQAAVRGDTPRIPFTATATSGLPVAVTIVSGAGSLSDGYFYPAGSGEVVLVARQPGNDGYAPAAEVIRNIDVFTDPQTITFDLQAETREDAWRIPVAATASSGLPVTLTLVSGPGHLTGGFFYPTGAGDAVFSARQAGNAGFDPAPEVTRTLTIVPDAAPPVIQLEQADSFTVNASPGVLSGSVTDEAAFVTLTLLAGNGSTLKTLQLTPGQPFLFSPVSLSLGENQFTLRATGGNLTTEKTVVITWRPDHLFRLTGSAVAPEARSVSLDLETVTKGDVAGMVFDVTFPPQRFFTPVFEPGTSLGLALVEVNTSIPGTMRFSLASPLSPLPEGTWTIGSVHLRSRSFGTTPLDVPIGLAVSGVSDDEGMAVTAGLHAVGHSLQLVPREHTGDVNNNGTWDVGDAVLLQKLLTGLDAPQPWDHPLNDLNSSGGLDSGDVIKVLRAAAFIDPNIPPPAGAAARSPRDSGAESLTLAILNPDVRPGDVLRLEIRTSALIAPIPGASFAIEYPAAWLEAQGAQPVTPGPQAPAGMAQRIGQFPGSADEPARLTFAAGTVQPFGTSGQPLVLAGISLKVRPEAASAVTIPIRVTSVSLASTDGYDLRKPASAAALHHPNGSTFAAWRSAAFTAAQLADPQVSGFDADADGDGIANGMEFLLGGRPLDPRSPQVPEVFVGSDGFARFQFTQHPGIIDSTLIPEWSNRLSQAGDWQTSGLFTESSISREDGALVTILRAPSRVSAAPRLWFRLKASLQ